METMMKVEKAVTPVLSKIYVTNKQNLEYKISCEFVHKKKYIALVLDCSEGMGYYKLDGAKTRFDVMRENAKSFVNQFKDILETEICIFAYSDVAKKIVEFTRVDGESNSTNLTKIKEAIDALESKKNSNIGDGMHLAYCNLKNLNKNDGLKCMVVMTGGQPDMFTTVSEHLYHDFETLEGNIDFNTGDNSSANVYADCYSAVRYGQEIAKFIAKEKIMTFAVGFTKKEAYKLEAIAAVCAARVKEKENHYYHVGGAKDIEYVCNGILEDLEASHSIISFNEIMPLGVEVLTVPKGLNFVILDDKRYKVSGELKDIKLIKMDNNPGNFKIEPWEGTVGIKYIAEGTKSFKDSVIKYKDQYGNEAIEELASELNVEVFVDKIAPITTCSLSGTTGKDQCYLLEEKNEYHSSDVTITLSATDGVEGTGVEKTEYKVDDATEWKNYEKSFIVSREGESTIHFRSVDIAGNVEEDKSKVFYIDKSAPSVRCILDGTKGIMAGWFVSDVKVELRAVDEPQGYNSGIKKVEYRFDENKSWEEYRNQIIISNEGGTKIYYRAMDNVGNTSEVKYEVIKIDKTEPVLTLPEDLNYIASGDRVKLSTIGKASAQDDNSGVKGEAKHNRQSMIFPVGTTDVIWTVQDNSGNTSTKNQRVTINTTEKYEYKHNSDYTNGVENRSPSEVKIYFEATQPMVGKVKIWYAINNWILEGNPENYTEQELRDKGYSFDAMEPPKDMATNGEWEYLFNRRSYNGSTIRYFFVYTKAGVNYTTNEYKYVHTACKKQ